MTRVLTPALMGLIPPLSLLAFRGTVPILATLAILGIVALRGDCLRLRVGRWVPALFALLLAWGAMTALWEQTAGLALPKTAVLALLWLGGIATVAFLRALPEDSARLAMTALIIGMTVAAVFNAVDVHLDGPVVRRLHAMLGQPVAAVHSVKPAKAAATLYALWGLPLALLCWHRGWRIRAFLAMGSAILLLMTAHSSTGMVALAGGITMVAIALAAPKVARGLVTAVLVVGFASAPLTAKLPDSYQIADAFRFMPPSALHRTAIWKFTGQRLSERPWLGWGLDGARSLPGGEDDIPVTLKVTDKPRTAESNCQPNETCVMMQQALPLHPHNFILQIWVELGVPGAAIGLALLLAILYALPLGGLGGAAALGTLTTGLGIALTGYGIWQAWWVAGLWLAVAVCFLAWPRGEPT